MPTRALEKSTRVNQVDNHVIKINTTRLKRRPHVRKTNKESLFFFQVRRDVRDIRSFLSDLPSINRAGIEFSPFQRLVIFIYLFILLRLKKVFI